VMIAHANAAVRRVIKQIFGNLADVIHESPPRRRRTTGSASWTSCDPGQPRATASGQRVRLSVSSRGGRHRHPVWCDVPCGRSSWRGSFRRTTWSTAAVAAETSDRVVTGEAQKLKS
jgi:hypothetical protein